MNTDFVRRVQRLERFLQSDPANPVLLRDLAQAHHQSGDQDKALEVCTKLTQLEGESAATLNLMASAHLARDRWSEAADLLAKAVKLDPNNAPLRFNLGYAQYARGDAKAALPEFKRATELDSKNPRFFCYLKLVCDDLGDKDGAGRALARALALEPGNVEANVLAAYQEVETGNIEAARRIVDTTVRRNPGSPAALSLRADLAMLDFDAERALPDLQRAIAAHPSEASLHASYGQALLALHRFGEAEKALRKALELDVTLATAWVALGWARLLQNDLAGAAAAFTAGFRTDASSAEAHAGLAMVRMREEKMPECERSIATALQLDPKCVTALWLRSGLANMRERKAGSPKLIDDFLAGHALGPLGWSNRELFTRAANSPTGRKAMQDMLRQLEQHRQAQTGAKPQG